MKTKEECFKELCQKLDVIGKTKDQFEQMAGIASLMSFIEAIQTNAYNEGFEEGMKEGEKAWLKKTAN